MPACTDCDAPATHDTDPFGDYGVACCREHWIERVQPRRGPQARGPDWAERNPEAADHEAARNRMRVVENRGARR